MIDLSTVKPGYKLLVRQSYRTIVEWAIVDVSPKGFLKVSAGETVGWLAPEVLQDQDIVDIIPIYGYECS